MPAEQAWIAANVDPKKRAQALGKFLDVPWDFSDSPHR